MGHARTQRGAKRRVTMKHAIRRAGGKIDAEATNKEIERKYRRLTGKTPPRY